jgi:hypothetical protein
MAETQQPIGTKYSNEATTLKKCQTLKRTRPDLAAFAANLFGLTETDGAGQSLTTNTGSNKTTTLDSLDRYSRNVIQTLFSVELEALNNDGTSSTQTEPEGAGSTIANKIGGGIDAVHDSLLGAKQEINEILKPVSSEIGSTLASLTGMLKNPLGAPFAIPAALASVVDRVSPTFSNKLDAAFKQFKINEIQNLPSEVMGSLRSLASKADKLLEKPLAIATDLYRGVMKIMQKISELIDSIITKLFDFIFGPDGVLDSILPIKDILSFIDAVSSIASEISSIGNMFGGLSFVNDYVSQFQSYASQAKGILSDPKSFAMSYLPPEAGQFLNQIRNPEQFLQSIIPPEISQQLSQVSQLPGLGFLGNMGYGVEETLSKLQGGFVTQILEGFVSQAGILKPLLGENPSSPPISNTQQEYPPTVDSALTGGQPSVQGIPVSLAPRPKVLPERTQ